MTTDRTREGPAYFSRPALLIIPEEESMIIGLTALALIIVISIAAWPWMAYLNGDNHSRGNK